MPKLYVLDVPEFQPVIDALKSQKIATEYKGGYACFRSDHPIELARPKMHDATWFGFPVAGIVGTLAEHTDTRFRLI